jgi:hypothetical protein
MLTKTPKQGDEVLIVCTRKYRDETPRLRQIEKVGRKYLFVCGEKFDFTGKHVSDYPSYSLWDSQEAYDRHIQRGKNKAKIFKLVSAHDFGNGLSDETLDQILQLINGKQS